MRTGVAFLVGWGGVFLRVYKSCGWTFLAAENNNKSVTLHLQLKKLLSGKHAHIGFVSVRGE